MTRLKVIRSAKPTRDDGAARLMRAGQAARRAHPDLADDGDWRDLLERLTGRRSMREMTRSELAKVLDHLNGGKRKPAGQVRGDKPHAGKIARMWEVLTLLGGVGPDDADGLNGFVLRQTGIASPDWLPSAQASSVIEALRARITRAGWAVPAGNAATKDEAQRGYAAALHARLVALGEATGDLDIWLACHVGIRAFGSASTAQIEAGVKALEDAIWNAMKGGAHVG